MERPIRLGQWSQVVALAFLISGCGGGGGSGQTANPSPTPVPTLAPGENTPTPTTTPLRASSSRNERTETSDAGAITLRIASIEIGGGQTTSFSVFLTDPSGRPAADERIKVHTGIGLEVLAPEDGVGVTRGDGTLSGSVRGVSGGTFALTVSVEDENSRFDGLSVTLTVIVFAPRPGSPTPTGGATTATPTPLPCTDVATIIVQTDTFNVSSQAGGTPLITAVVFDSNNLPVSKINVLFDVQPRIATFNPLVKVAGSEGELPGQASTRMTIPPNSSFGTLIVSATACGQTGSVAINIVSGVSTKPVSSVVLQADPATVGSLSGGTINLTAAVFDADNKPIDGIDALFITTVGKVNPLVQRTKLTGSQGGIATSVLQVPIGAIEQEYVVSALAGGVTGSTRINVVPGRVGPGTINPGVPPGEPASITLGASPTRLQVSGTGGTDLATVIGRVFDNNGNPLSGVRVHYHVVTAQSAPGAVILPVTTPTPSGTATPVPATRCSPDDPVSVSDTAGFAVIQVRSGTQPGPVTVAACTDTIVNGVPSPLIEQQALFTVTSGPVNRIGLTINRRFIDNNDGSLLTTLSAVVTDAQGNTVEDGTPVFFEILTRRVCAGGSNDSQPCTNNSSCTGGACVEDESDPSRNVAISSNSTTNALPPCDVSQFSAQLGFPISPQPGDAITCIKYPDLQQGTEVLVRATVGGVVSNISGQALSLPGTIGNLEVSIAPSTVSVSNTEEGLALIRAGVFTSLADGLENVRVRFNTTVGTIDRSVLSDADGEALATLEIPAGTPSGTATLRVSGGGLQISNISVPIINTGGGTPTPGTGTEPAAVRFIDAQPAEIGVRGSGLPEQSKLTFEVTDAQGTPRPGVPVTFSIARIADESISPNQAVTDDAGRVQVTLTAGRRALSVQVTAQVTTIITTLLTRSTRVNILGGPPSQPNFSLAHRFANISGRVTFGIQDEITAFVADRFGNPVPPGTAVNFTTKGGAIADPSTTSQLGQATATLISQAPIAANGIVASLATTNGERPFADANGSGVCDDEDTLMPVSEPFYDANCNRVYDNGEDFIDLNSNGRFDTDQISDASGQPTCGDQIVVFEAICTTFSGPTHVLLLNSGSSAVEAGGTRDFTLIISDNPDPIGNPGVGNPIVGGSTVSISVQGNRGRILGITTLTIPDTQTTNRIIDGVNRFQFSVTDSLPTSLTSEVSAVVVNVFSAPGSLAAGGNGSVTIQSPLTFLAAPTPTPTVTVTPSLTPTDTPVPTPTPTPVPPAIAPTQITLAGGSGAPPNACNGSSQTFVVTGGSPPFTVFAGGGCVSTNSVPASGGSFTLTAGNTLGDFSVTVTDALGRTAAAGVTVLGPPTPTFTHTPPATETPTPRPTRAPTPGAAFVRLEQIRDRVTDNRDGTFSTLLSALVTDASGAAISDGVPVEFSLVNPVPGVSVTSPGLTNQSPPCTISFEFVLQPGDAFSCLKYVAALQGTTVQVRARVQTTTGAFVEDVREIVLIDTRPTATPTAPIVTPSATPTVPPPVIVPASATLYAGVGAPPNCNGVSRSFVVTGGAPPFTLSAGGGGCLNPSVVTASGGSFSFTSGGGVGTFVITAIDALGRIATATITQQGPPAAFISVDLFEDRRADNGDGSFTSVVTALVTDAGGATIADGVPVEFSLANPVAGVSITSPAFTNQAPPCQLTGLTVVPQPGDALACIKYVSSRQGSTITVRARVTTANGSVIQAEKEVTLPDTRPKPTPTNTPTATHTHTPTVTPSLTPFPPGVATFTPTPTATTTPTPPPGSIEFLGATPVIIGVRGSGRPEQAVLTYRVKNTLNQPIAGVLVKFTLTGSGTEFLNPPSAVTGTDGTVVTTISSGTRATTVRVAAGADTNGDAVADIFAQSTGLSILGGPPSKNRFSIAPARRNVAGRARTGVTDVVSAFVNDRFGNAVPAGTAVSFVTNASSVVNPMTTDVNGVAQATLLSEQVVPPTGIVSVMAFTLGEETFLDNNGNGRFDGGDTILTDDIREPFVDFRPLPPSLAGLGPNDSACPIAAPSGLCNGSFDVATPFEFFIDSPPLDGVWGSQGTHDIFDDNIFVFDTTFVTFSGPLVAPIASTTSLLIPPNGNGVITVDVHDDLLNPLVGGSTISVFANRTGITVAGSPLTIPDGHSFNRLIDGLTRFSFVVQDTASLPGEPFTLEMQIASENGNGTFVLATGKVLEFTPTPTFTPTSTPVPTTTTTPTVAPTTTLTPTITPTPTATPPAGSIQFLNALPASIGVRGSGLPEQSLLTFRVNNTLGGPIPGVTVQFTLTGTGSESLNPLTAVSDQAGQVTTAVTSGIQAATVRVVASLLSNPAISAQSTAVSVLGAPPAVNHFSLAPALRNIQGRVSFGLQDQISVFVNDRFGNAVPSGTAVSFITNAASVVNPTTTDASGVATATLVTEGVVPSSGIVTVMAFTRGEESFLDNNGNGIFDAGDTVLTDDLPEPFIDFRPLPPSDAGCTVFPPSRFCNGRFDTGTAFERFVDTNGNGIWNSGPPPMGTLGQGTHDAWDNNIFVFGTTSVTFSGPLVAPILAGCSSGSCNPFTITNGGSITFTINVHDDLVNPLVGGSTITVTSSAGQVSGGTITVPDGQSFNQLLPGLTQFSFVVADADPMAVAAPPAPATVVVTVTSPNGNGTAIVAAGTVE